MAISVTTETYTKHYESDETNFWTLHQKQS